MFHIYVIDKFKQDLIYQKENQIAQQSIAFNEALINKNDGTANKQLNALNTDNSIISAAIFLPNGSILSHFSKQQQYLPEFKAGPALLKTASQIRIIQPVQKDQSIIGYIDITHDTRLLFSQFNIYYYLLGASYIIFVIFSIAIALLLQKKLTSPIKDMAHNIQKIHQSNQFNGRLKPVKHNELEKLSSEFNLMLNAVQHRENELTMHGKQLQKLVEVRTEQLYQKAHFDSLTGLPNRYLLVERLHQAITASSCNNSKLALLFLDLDRFKVINDNLGHQNGDLLLKEVAKRLSRLARKRDTVARLGGDEFVLLLENLSSPEQAAKTAYRLLDSFKIPFELQEHILHVSTSIGISIFPDNGEDDKILLKNADISMYHAKEKGPGQFSFYTQEMNKTSLERLTIESNLRTAIEKNEFYLVYQPQMRLKNNQFNNVEALLRWRNKAVGEISPAIFVPIAEETGVVNQIDLWVISQACQQIKIWKGQGLTDITVAVNISAGHLISNTLLEHIKKQIILNGINASQLEIEITEAVFVEHTERTIRNLTAIKNLGVKIAIDDFGTGYSSLQYIQDFPADTLKLDGMFIKNLSENESSQGIVRSTIMLAHSLGLEIVAECVENQFQLDFLRQYQCDLVQGFLLSKPVTPAETMVLCSQVAVQNNNDDVQSL